MPNPNPQALGLFPTTHWSLVGRAGGGADAGQQGAALVELLTRYMPALRLHLIARKRMDEHRADDAMQAFLASKILEQGIIERAEKEKGKFRTFLLTALDRFLISEIRKDSAIKRGAGQIYRSAKTRTLPRVTNDLTINLTLPGPGSFWPRRCAGPGKNAKARAATMCGACSRRACSIRCCTMRRRRPMKNWFRGSA